MKNYLVLLPLISCLVVCTAELSESSLKLYFFSRSNPKSGILVNVSDPASLAKTSFTPTKDTFFHAHGFLETANILLGSSQVVKDAVLATRDVNVFLVDSSIVFFTTLYPTIVENRVEVLGNMLGRRIQKLVSDHGLKLANVTLSGHSLGAQIVGVTGQFLQGEVAQVIGTDPAGPLFSSQITRNRMIPASGKRVEAIHTSGGPLGFLGFRNATAHADFYINGAIRQPICTFLDIFAQCSHILAPFYQAKSITKGGFIGRRCDSYENFKKGFCNNEPTAYMGGYFIDPQALGKYYVTTGLIPPIF